MRDQTLWALARLPFLSAAELGSLQGISARAARAQLARLCRAGLAEYVTLPGARLHLSYLTATGVAEAARAAGSDPDALAARYGLDERALRRRLPGLARLVASRRVLLLLHHALASAGGALEEWQAWPVLWQDQQEPRRHVLPLDGDATLVWPVPAARWRVGYLWDGDRETPAEVLHERLARLQALAQAPAYSPPSALRVPPVLLVTAAAWRVPPGYRPGLLWTTTAEIAARGPLDAAWWGSQLGGEACPLRAALATVGPLGANPTPSACTLGVSSTAPTVAPAPHFAQRARALRAAPRAGPESLSLLALALPPRALTVLALVGAHPLFSRRHIARATGLARSDLWAMVALLCRHELLAPWRPPHGPAVQRYVLTARGVRLLARCAGLTPQAYRRLYGVLDAGTRATQGGLRFLQGTWAHTDMVHACYLALWEAARQRGGTLWWRGEWACQRPFLDGARLRVLRPDAEGLYTGDGGRLHFYLEVDRGTTRAAKLEGKLAQYSAYRTVTATELTVLVVTLGQGRCAQVLTRVAALAMCTGQAPLDVRTTTLEELWRHGPWARIWRDDAGPCALLSGP